MNTAQKFKNRMLEQGGIEEKWQQQPVSVHLSMTLMIATETRRKSRISVPAKCIGNSSRDEHELELLGFLTVMIEGKYAETIYLFVSAQ